jgi:hypothetical protein
MLTEAYELGVDDAVEYVEKIAGMFSKKKKEGLVEKARRKGRELKDVAVKHGKSAYGHVAKHKGKYGAGAAALGAAGGGAAYYANRKK